MMLAMLKRGISVNLLLKNAVLVAVALLGAVACHGNSMNYPSYGNTGTDASSQQESQQSSETSPATTSSSSTTDQSSDFKKPMGIFVSSGPTVSDKVLSQSHVAGNLVRVGWNDVQPSSTAFDFSKIDALINQAKSHNKVVSLSVLNGPRTPQWLYEKGAESFDYTFMNRYSERGNREEKIPLPWDSIYLQYWTALIEKLGERYSDEPAVALVHITHSSKNGFEMHLPEQRVSGRRETVKQGPWADAGYAINKHVSALKTVVDAFAHAFPNTPIDIEIHPVLDSLEPAEQIFTYGTSQYGKRFGLLTAWWSGKVQPWNQAMIPILERACTISFCNIQMIGNQTRQPERLLDGSLMSSMAVAEQMGARYFEVWSADLRNAELSADLASFSLELK